MGLGDYSVVHVGARPRGALSSSLAVDLLLNGNINKGLIPRLRDALTVVWSTHGVERIQVLDTAEYIDDDG